MKKNNSGFVTTLVVIILALGVAYFIKDENGVSYLEKGYNAFRYYVVDRNQEAVDKAKEVRDLMQNNQSDIQKEIDSI
jgi:hypothetical protein